jgi:hypothetical protein
MNKIINFKNKLNLTKWDYFLAVIFCYTVIVTALMSTGIIDMESISIVSIKYLSHDTLFFVYLYIIIRSIIVLLSCSYKNITGAEFFKKIFSILKSSANIMLGVWMIFKSTVENNQFRMDFYDFRLSEYINKNLIAILFMILIFAYLRIKDSDINSVILRVAINTFLLIYTCLATTILCFIVTSKSTGIGLIVIDAVERYLSQ